jgi:hypothetical protein
MECDPQSNQEKDSSSRFRKKGFGIFWSELRRRKVVRLALTYAVVAELQIVGPLIQ